MKKKNEKKIECPNCFYSSNNYGVFIGDGNIKCLNCGGEYNPIKKTFAPFGFAKGIDITPYKLLGKGVIK